MRNLSKKDLSILIGNSLDHFDTTLYTLLAPHLAPLFFPNTDKTVQLIMAYSVLATSIFTRPLGAIIFGMIARRAPAQGLYYSLIGLAITTTMIGFLPDYNTIGWLAPTGLIIIRLAQGIFAEGETVIARLYILENKSDTKALQASYLYHSSTVFGIVFASAATWAVEVSPFTNAWRICFWGASCTGLIGYYLRRYSINKRDMLQVSAKINYLNLLSIIWKHKVIIVQIAAIINVSYLTYSIPFIIMNSFIPLITDIRASTMLALNTSLLIFDMLFIPICGKYAQKYPPALIMKNSCMVLAVTIIPLWYSLNHASLWYVTAVRLWIVIWGIMFLCPLNLWCKKLVNSPDQYLVVGIGNALASATVGRLTPVICLSLWHITNISLSIAFYIAVIIIGAIYVINRLTKKVQ
ncbi:MFS transporter [Candidatus Trichorickettsia mobilis]|uniref:MFS transporter n=1 Tax=Candidatus Trichorickettsia mobilis TaxID=1346319 RepID=A0ABZ0UTB3_9RICK|nr:MFS transporter [Candidatus Trichorickettsia mobilis]WPY01280.1 MFS transporter [Candidatus Trichorickettsia mobilis]